MDHYNEGFVNGVLFCTLVIVVELLVYDYLTKR